MTKIAEILTFLGVGVVILIAVAVLSLYKNAKGVPYDIDDIANTLIFISLIGVGALLFLVKPEKS